jgi:hypothetical protein
MNTILVSLLLLAPPVAPVDSLTTLPSMSKICVDTDQRPMMGDPHGPPVVCMKDGDTDFPLKHGSCGANCTTHVPMDGAADAKVPVRIDFFCPDGVEVQAVSYQLDGQKRVVLRGAGAANTFSSAREVSFSKAKVAAACKEALGGTWLKNGKHSNPRERIETALETKIELHGGCEGEDKLRRSRFRVRLAVTCVDEDF